MKDYLAKRNFASNIFEVNNGNLTTRTNSTLMGNESDRRNRRTVAWSPWYNTNTEHIPNRTLDSPIRRENILSPSIDALSNPSDDGDSQTKGHYDWAARRSPTASVNGSRTGFGTQYDEHKSNGMWCPSSVTVGSGIVILLLMVTTNVLVYYVTASSCTCPPPATIRLPQANNTPIIVDALTLPHKLINNALPSYHAQHHTNLLHPTVKYTPTKLTTPAQYIPTLTPNKATTTVAIHQLLPKDHVIEISAELHPVVPNTTANTKDRTDSDDRFDLAHLLKMRRRQETNEALVNNPLLQTNEQHNGGLERSGRKQYGYDGGRQPTNQIIGVVKQF